jgi:hypothetical protein
MASLGPDRTSFALIVKRRISREIIATDCIRWLSTGGVSSLGNARQMGLSAAYREACICCEIYATKAAGSPAAKLF